jgi:hypothetical protein
MMAGLIPLRSVRTVFDVAEYTVFNTSRLIKNDDKSRLILSVISGQFILSM